MLYAEMCRQRTQNAFEQLANQNNPFAAAQRGRQLFSGFAAQLWFQNVVKIFFAEQIEAVAGDAAQQRVQKTRCESAAGGIGERANQRHSRHARAARPAFGEAAPVPGEEAHGTQRAKLEKRAFHAPIRDLFAGGADGGMLRIGMSFWHACWALLP